MKNDRCGICDNCRKLERVRARMLAATNDAANRGRAVDSGLVDVWNDAVKRWKCEPITRETLTVDHLIDLDCHEIARILGIHYSGDINGIVHGGLFYSLADWEPHGYADCVEFSEVDGAKIGLEIGSINRKTGADLVECLKTIGGHDIPDDELTAHVELDACHATWGMDVSLGIGANGYMDETYLFDMWEDEDGAVRAAAERALPHILALTPDKNAADSADA